MKTRKTWIPVLAAAMLLTTLFFLQRTEAKKSVPDTKKSSVSNDKDKTKGSAIKKVAPKAQEQDQIISGASIRNDISPNLRDMTPIPYTGKGEEREAAENPKIPHSPHKDSPDMAVQDPAASMMALISPSMPAPILNFAGIPFPGVACNCAPPDTNGEVGATQYVQIVNEGYQVFNKTTGASVLGPLGIQTIWTGFGGVCETTGDGDPVVLYDQLANRWVVTQFAGSPIPTHECIAVSTGADATGSYARYDFLLGSNFFDYPHLAVWPNAYYMSMNVFNSSGTAFLGPQAFAFDRNRMLAGLSATFVSPGITGGPNEDSFLPSDLDGSALPPVGAPGTFVEMPFTNTYRVFHFAPDFIVPGNTTFTLFAAPPAAAFTELCPTTRACVPQLAPQTNVDGIADRLMFRLATRFIGGIERTVGNFTVSSNSVAGIRWFELRNVTTGPVTVFQESTYQPDTTWRWMGSAAQDMLGNMALGFSASDATIHPQVRYAGRLVADPINTLAQGEAHLFDGAGSQSGTSSRWGDYSDLTIDPVDDCTFWYTQEYYDTNSAFNWRTRIGNFKFPTCNGIPTPVIVADGSSIVNESCPPATGAIDPGETVTVRLALRNSGTGPTTSLVATLQPTANVLAPSGPENYGAIPVGGTASRDFTFTANGTCGQTITLTLQLQDGPTNLGTVTYNFQLGTTVVTTSFSENFDGVIAPALPAGWTTTFSGILGAPWTTSTVTPFSAPNDAFANDPSNIADDRLDSPTIAVPAGGAQLTFKNNYNLESSFDGEVLEISINGGAFQDITTGGNAFVAGGYNGTISTAFGSPIAGRPAWTANSGGYINSTINMPAAADGQNVQLRWRMASDNSVSATGVRIDNIVISNTTFVCNTACAGAPRISVSSTLSCSGSNKVATITVCNSGTATANSVVLTTAALGGVSGTPLPQSLGNLAPGACATTTVTFSGAPSGATTLQTGGTYTGGSFNSNRRVTAPTCGP